LREAERAVDRHWLPPSVWTIGRSQTEPFQRRWAAGVGVTSINFKPTMGQGFVEEEWFDCYFCVVVMRCVDAF
jgi:hypothetical protein